MRFIPQTLHKIKGGIAHREFERCTIFNIERLTVCVPVFTFCNANQGDRGDEIEFSENTERHVKLPFPPINQHDIWAGGEGLFLSYVRLLLLSGRGEDGLLLEPRKAAQEHLA